LLFFKQAKSCFSALPFWVSMSTFMDLDWYCTNMLKVGIHADEDFYELFSSLEKQSTSDFTHLTFRQNRVIIVSSVIAKIFNPHKCWTVTIQLPLNDTLFNQCFLLFIASYFSSTFIQCLFVRFSAYLMQCLLFDSILLLCICIIR
jgi:hypothetical protein